MKRAEMANALAELTARVTELERLRKKDTHEHRWTYRKAVGGRIGSTFSGPWTFWSWTCEGAEICGTGDSGTNNGAMLPDHFPDDLR